MGQRRKEEKMNPGLNIRRLEGSFERHITSSENEYCEILTQCLRSSDRVFYENRSVTIHSRGVGRELNFNLTSSDGEIEYFKFLSLKLMNREYELRKDIPDQVEKDLSSLMTALKFTRK